MPVVIKRSELNPKKDDSAPQKPKKQSGDEGSGSKTMLIALVGVSVLAVAAFAMFGTGSGGENKTATTGAQTTTKADADKTGGDSLSGLGKKKGAGTGDDM